MSLPNVLFILADDLGYGDVGANNPESRIPTPHLDRLAAAGMRFTNAHASAAQCSPTRYSIMTGRYPWRSRLKTAVLRHFDTPLLDVERETLASLFKAQGYATAGIGKWHLGLGWQAKPGHSFDPDSWDPEQVHAIDFTKPLTDSPLDHGFDTYFGLNASNNMLPYCFIENDRVVKVPEKTKYPVFDTESKDMPVSDDYVSRNLDQLLLGKALDWMDDHLQTDPDQPFFLYFPSSAIHRPCLPTDEFVGRSDAGLRGDKVAELDAIVGTLMDALETHGVADNTIVIFTSDNGALPGDLEDAIQTLADNEYGSPWQPERLLAWKGQEQEEGLYARWLTYDHRSCGPYRGYKGNVYDGGHRVPCLVRWPGRVPAGRVEDETICLTDFMATFAALFDADLPDNVAEDSYNLLPLLLGRKPEHPVREATICQSWWGVKCIYKGPWKLIVGNGKDGIHYEKGDASPMQLYHIVDDAGETRNVCDQHAEVVAELTALLEKACRDERSAPPIRFAVSPTVT
ncbi:MAG: arylsulfatase [Kiritimatiellia bacterium]|jgi:arylsulfatase A-like enzyme|nr:arylsulfatase [Kiritimatiellia bacterium]